jgi:TM2 domain-containing membrane protein YozV
MPIVVTCPSCSTALKAPDTAAGKRFKCPKCSSAIEVPADAAPEAEEAFADEPAPAPARKGEVRRREERAPAPPPPADWVSNRTTVGLVALLSPAGAVGAHKFILGKNTAGWIMLAVSVVGMFCTGGLAFIAMQVISTIEGIKYLRMTDAEFYETYVAGDKAWL